MVLWVVIIVLIIAGVAFIVAGNQHKLAAISFLFAVFTFIFTIHSQTSGSIGCITETTEPTTTQTASYSKSEDSTVTETDTETDVPDENESEPKITDEIAENNNIITNDSDVKGSFSNASTEEYVLKSKFRNNYGFIFRISDVNLSYAVFIIDETGEVLYDYHIGEDNISESPMLEKNTTYTLRVEADEGSPEYTIEIKYPDSDIY